jgi:hypothetical protein
MNFYAHVDGCFRQQETVVLGSKGASSTIEVIRKCRYEEAVTYVSVAMQVFKYAPNQCQRAFEATYDEQKEQLKLSVEDVPEETVAYKSLIVDLAHQLADRGVVCIDPGSIAVRKRRDQSAFVEVHKTTCKSASFPLLFAGQTALRRGVLQPDTWRAVNLFALCSNSMDVESIFRNALSKSTSKQAALTLVRDMKFIFNRQDPVADIGALLGADVANPTVYKPTYVTTEDLQFVLQNQMHNKIYDYDVISKLALVVLRGRLRSFLGSLK